MRREIFVSSFLFWRIRIEEDMYYNRLRSFVFNILHCITCYPKEKTNMVIDSGNYDPFQEESREERDMLLNNDN